jgi:hypothetical protein
LAYQPGEWESFALAHLGASAALLGLVFVGISINLRDFVGSRQLVDRAAEAVILLGTVLVASTAVLIPGQGKGALSTELLVLAAATFAVIVSLQRGIKTQRVDLGKPGPPPVSVVLRRVLGLGAPVFLAVAGITLAASSGGGLYWWPAAILVAYAGALSDAWVLLIEILR